MVSLVIAIQTGNGCLKNRGWKFAERDCEENLNMNAARAAIGMLKLTSLMEYPF